MMRLLKNILFHHKQWLLELAEFEEIVVLLQLLNRLGVGGADLLAGVFAGAGFKIRLVLILFTANTVEAFEGTLVDKAKVVNLLQELLNVLLVSKFSGSDEILVINVNGLK